MCRTIIYQTTKRTAWKLKTFFSCHKILSFPSMWAHRPFLFLQINTKKKQQERSHTICIFNKNASSLAQPNCYPYCTVRAPGGTASGGTKVGESDLSCQDNMAIQHKVHKPSTNSIVGDQMVAHPRSSSAQIYEWQARPRRTVTFIWILKGKKTTEQCIPRLATVLLSSKS